MPLLADLGLQHQQGMRLSFLLRTPLHCRWFLTAVPPSFRARAVPVVVRADGGVPSSRGCVAFRYRVVIAPVLYMVMWR